MLFEEFVKNQPLLSIIVFSFVIALFLTLAYKLLTNQKRIKELREEQKKFQERIRAEKDRAKMMDIQKEMLRKSAELMHLTMRPTLITFIPILFVFIFLRNLYTTAKVGAIISWSINIPIFCGILPGLCDGAGWLLSYILFSTIFSILIRKFLKVY